MKMNYRNGQYNVIKAGKVIFSHPDATECEQVMGLVNEDAPDGTNLCAECATDEDTLDLFEINPE